MLGTQLYGNTNGIYDLTQLPHGRPRNLLDDKSLPFTPTRCVLVSSRHSRALAGAELMEDQGWPYFKVCIIMIMAWPRFFLKAMFSECNRLAGNGRHMGMAGLGLH